MSQRIESLVRMLKQDPRYKLEAYQFVREALTYAQEEMGMGDVEEVEDDRHLTGRELCEAIREFALEQYGYMSKVVLNSWGVRSTADFGEIVYNLIRIELMKKSDTDRKEDFHDVYDFDEAFQDRFEITMPD